VHAAPAVSCAKCAKRCAHEHTGTAEALRHSLRNGLTAYAELSLETNSSCLHHCRLDGSIDPVGSISPPAAWHQPRVSGPHGFAVRFSADHLARCARSRITALQTRFAPDAAASTASRPAFVTTRDPPLLSRRDARKKPLIWGGWEAEYFCAGGWMTQISRKLFNKSPFVRNDSGSLCRAGASRKAMPRGQVVLSQARYMYACISDDLSKAFPIAPGPRPPASLQFFSCRS
jgi:hypothetical protein